MGGGLGKKKNQKEAFAETINEEDITGNHRWHVDKEFKRENSFSYTAHPEYLELRNMLEEPLGQSYIGDFAKSEQTHENFFAWVDMEEYRHIPTPDFKRSMARHIFRKYIRDGAPLQLGVLTPEMTKEFKALIFVSGKTQDPKHQNFRKDVDPQQDVIQEEDEEEGDDDDNSSGSSSKGVESENMFNHLQHVVFKEMAENTFRRFKGTEKYQDYLNKKNTAYNKIMPDDFVYRFNLGQGGFGSVVAVSKKSTQCRYAMKIQLKTELIRSFKRHSKKKTKKRVNYECSVLKKSHHPFIVQMHYAFQTPGEVLLVMEMAEGGTLKDLIKSFPDNVVNEETIIFIAAEVMLALRHLHFSNYVYRDLKPDNVLIDRQGHVKLADMGLCGEIDESLDDDTKMDIEAEKLDETKTDLVSSADKPFGRRCTVVGTKGFQAPELLNTKETKQGYGVSVDWWAYGVMLLTMAGGHNPYQGNKTIKKEEVPTSYIKKEIQEKLSADFLEFLNSLLLQDPKLRLGTNEKGARGIREHVIFSAIDFDQLLHKGIDPPYDMKHINFEENDKDETIIWKSYEECKTQTAEASGLAKYMLDPIDDSEIMDPEEMDWYFDGWYYVSPTTLKLELGNQEKHEHPQ